MIINEEKKRDLLLKKILYYRNEKLCCTNQPKKFIKLYPQFIEVMKDTYRYLSINNLTQLVYHFVFDLEDVPLCPICESKNIFKGFVKGYTECCSTKCSSMGSRNGFYGKKHDEDTRRRMSENHANVSGDKNPFKKRWIKDPEFRKEFIQTHKELWKNRGCEWREIWSQNLSAVMPSPKHSKHKRGYYFSSKNNRLSYFRSSWEEEFLYYLDACEFIVDFKIEPFKIEYLLSNDSVRYTKVDFEIEFDTGEKALIEIKPYVLTVRSYDKILGIECYCLQNQLQFLVLNEDCFKTENFRLEDVMEDLYNGKYKLEEALRQGATSPLFTTKEM